MRLGLQRGHGNLPPDGVSAGRSRRVDRSGHDRRAAASRDEAEPGAQGASRSSVPFGATSASPTPNLPGATVEPQMLAVAKASPALAVKVTVPAATLETSPSWQTVATAL